MSKIFLSIIGVHLLMVYFFSVTLDRVDATSSTAGPLISSPTNRNFRHSRLQKLYPVLRNQRLTNNMLSLLQSLRRQKLHKRRQHRMKRKGAFVVSDLDGNPMLVVRKQKIRQQANYPNQQPAMYDPQKLGLFPFAPVPNFQVPSNMVPFQQVIQPLPYNLENPNPLVQRQAAFPSMVAPQPANVLPQPAHVLPPPANVLPQPDASQANDLNAPEIKDSPHDEYYDNFELIPLQADKSPSLLKTDPPLRRFSSFLFESTTEPESSSAAPPTLLAILASSITTTTAAPQNSELIKKAIDQSSELIKQAIPRDTNNLDQTKGVVNVVSLLAAVLEKAFSVPHDAVFPHVKRGSTSSSSIMDLPTQGLAASCSVEPILSVTDEGVPSTVKREDNKTRADWRDFQLGLAFSMIRTKTTPTTTGSVTTEEIIVSSPAPLVEVSSAEIPVEPIKYTNEDVSAVLQDVVNPPDQFNIIDANLPRYKLEDNTSHCSSMIQKILETVQNIQGQEPDTKLKQDLPACNITGFWSSLAGGMILEITNGTNHSIKLHPKTPPSKKGILLEPEWDFTVIKPFPKFNIIILNGFNKNCKQVASFVGECRVCSGCESITGNWLLGHPSRTCKEQLATEELLGDVWARETLTDRRNEKLRSIYQLSKPARLKDAKAQSNKNGTCH